MVAVLSYMLGIACLLRLLCLPHDDNRVVADHPARWGSAQHGHRANPGHPRSQVARPAPHAILIDLVARASLKFGMVGAVRGTTIRRQIALVCHSSTHSAAAGSSTGFA
jgi:hypothetical protein